MWYLKNSISYRLLLISLVSLAILAVACGSSAVQEQPVAQKEAVVPKEAVKEVPKAAVTEVPKAAVVQATTIPIQESAVPTVNPGPSR